jgi:hypothetical protein
MSSLLFAGMFSLHGGHRAQTSYNKRSVEKGSAWHAYHKTAVICQASPLLPAEVRVYSRVQDVLYPGRTVALIFAKAFVPPANVGCWMQCTWRRSLETRRRRIMTSPCQTFTGRWYLQEAL